MCVFTFFIFCFCRTAGLQYYGGPWWGVTGETESMVMINISCLPDYAAGVFFVVVAPIYDGCFNGG